MFLLTFLNYTAFSHQLNLSLLINRDGLILVHQSHLLPRQPQLGLNDIWASNWSDLIHIRSAQLFVEVLDI